MRRSRSPGRWYNTALWMSIACAAGPSAIALAQDTALPSLQPPMAGPAQPRYYGGWQSANNSASSPLVRQANFQAPLPLINDPASLNASVLPPAAGMQPNGMQPNGMQSPSGLPNAYPMSDGYGGANLPNTSAVQPAAFDQFSNPGGYLPPTDVRQASGSGLREAQVNHPAGVQPGMQPGMQPGYRPTVMQQGGQVYPPGAYQPGAYPPGAYPPGYPQSGYGQQQLPPGQFRDAQSQVANQQQMGGGSIPVVSQDPRFISPPPRTGTYATSPYRSPYRTIGYQTNQGVPAQTVAQTMPPAVTPPLTVPTQPVNVANTSTLPQYQPTVGVYQTGYQYCPPGIPSGGVPSVVPGAVAPPTYPPNMTPQLYTPDNAGYRPLFSLGQENYNVQLGRGIIGQPTVYVPGQPVRNFLRYLSP